MYFDDKKARLASRKFWLTVYSVVLLPFLLHVGYIDGSHFVALYPMTLGLYFGGNVWESKQQPKIEKEITNNDSSTADS